jgi:hypothetical protein
LCPDEINKISESTQGPDVPLVFAKAVVVDLAVDQDALLLVQRQTLEFLACDTGQAVDSIAVVVLGRGRRARLGGVLVALFEWRETHGDVYVCRWLRKGVARMGEEVVQDKVLRGGCVGEEEKQIARQR